MKLYAAIFLIALIGAKSTKADAQVSFDNSLVNYLLTPIGSSAAAQNPGVAAQCFNLYLPELSEIANNYSTQYQACLTLANDLTTNLTNEAEQNRAAFVQKANDICTAYQDCNNLANTLGFFNCYAAVSRQEVTQVYDIENLAIGAANSLTQGLQQIQQNEEACTNETQRTYVQDTADTYQKLDICLENGLPDTVTTTAAPSTAAPTTSASTSETGTTAEVDNDNEGFVFAAHAAAVPSQQSSDGSQGQMQKG